jgi:hypothetical protein
MQTKNTKKRQMTKVFISSSDLSQTIFQPNRITNAQYHYTLIQERIFTYVIFYLQHYVKRVIKGEHVNQLEIFKDATEDVHIAIPLDYIVPGSPAQYGKVRQSAKSMAGIVVKIPYKDKDGRKWEEHTGLMSVHTPVETSDEKKRSKHIVIVIKKQIARMLVEIDKKEDRPVNFTSFVLGYAMSAKNKYTSRIYKYISSWKEKGLSHPIKLTDLKAMLGIEEEYPNYADFKKRVLVPVYEELREKADCWFEIEYEHFEQRTEGKVTSLIFQVNTQDKKLTECKL